MVKAANLKNLNLFSGLNESELAKIATISHLHTFEANSYVFTASKPATDLYFLISPNDAIQIEMQLHENKPNIIIHTLTKGEAFGWASLVPPHKRIAAARCVVNAELITIPGKSLLEILEKNNHIGYVLMRNLSALLSLRLNYTTIALRRECRNALPKGKK
jgi:CRP/FNR family transcriptional regulator